MGMTGNSARKFGMNLVNFSQHTDLCDYVNSDPRMPRKRLRRYLSQYGLRGDELNAEVRRIAAGPQNKDSILRTGIYYIWPYGWEPADFTPMMRRIFREKRTRHVMVPDEFYYYLDASKEHGSVK